MNWMMLPFQRYAEFEGRSCRQEYWLFLLLNIIIYVFLSVFFVLNLGLAAATAGTGAWGPVAVLCVVLLGVWGLVTFLPSLAVMVRRFHDQNMSGWFVLLALIPDLGSLVVLVFMCIPGTPGPNRFGADPTGGAIGNGGFGGPGTGGWQEPQRLPIRAPEPAAYTAFDTTAYDDAPQTQPAAPRRSESGLHLHGMTRAGHAVRFTLDPADPVLRAGNFTIGRGQACNAVVPDDSVSRSHAMCIVRGDQFLIRDMQSRNQTRVNGTVLPPDRPQVLRAGDVLRLGELELTISPA